MINMNFFVVGAQKTGTTTLHKLLSQHQDISLPRIKETHYFSHTDREERGIEWYLSRFKRENNNKLVGEIDPEYMYSPLAPKKIRQATTARKFIFILRRPLERAFSQYLMTQRRGYEQLDFAEALAAEAHRLGGAQPDFARDHWSYVARSLYAPQIENYLQVFPDAEFLFLRSETLTDKGARSGYSRICSFLQTVPCPELLEDLRPSNTASAPRSIFVRDFIYGTRGKSALRGVFASLLPSTLKTGIFNLLDNANQKFIGVDRSSAAKRVDVKLLAQMEHDLARCESLTGLDLSDWRAEIDEMESQHLPGHD